MPDVQIGLEEWIGACIAVDAALNEIAISGAREMDERAATFGPLTSRGAADNRKTSADG